MGNAYQPRVFESVGFAPDGMSLGRTIPLPREATKQAAYEALFAALKANPEYIGGEVVH